MNKNPGGDDCKQGAFCILTKIVVQNDESYAGKIIQLSVPDR